MYKIAIDYTPAIRQSAGIGRIIRGQIKALLDESNHDLRLFVVGPVSPSDQAASPQKLHTTPISERNMVRLWHRFNIPLPRVEWFTGGPLDLFHATDFVMAPNHARKKLVTVHDLAFLFYPDAAMPSLHRYLNVVVPRSVKRADHLLADSHHTARDLHREWDVPEGSITVVQGAVDHERFFPDDSPEEMGRQRIVRQRYGIGERSFILGLSRLEPRKNFVRLIEAFHLARQETDFPHRLVIGGSKGWLYEPIFARVKALGLEEDVLLPGFVDDDDLPSLYRAADFFAYPSLYEGFGLPILEALACGTPVLTANNSCLPEAGGDGAFYIDAEDTESIAAGLIRLASDTELRAALRTAGLVQAAKFTWGRSASQLLSAYAKVL